MSTIESNDWLWKKYAITCNSKTAAASVPLHEPSAGKIFLGFKRFRCSPESVPNENFFHPRVRAYLKFPTSPQSSFCVFNSRGYTSTFYYTIYLSQHNILLIGYGVIFNWFLELETVTNFSHVKHVRIERFAPPRFATGLKKILSYLREQRRKVMPHRLGSCVRGWRKSKTRM